MATDKIVAEYTVKVDLALKNLDKLASRVDKVDNERKKTQEGFKTMSKNMVSGFKKVGVALGLAFGAQQVISLGKEMVTLAAKAEGVERAFKRIGSAQLLDDLRKATRGTVSDLLLMQRAVQASNFKLPLDQLASLLKFASARARETGESVDYLVNSIVLGIGRKSPLILDNLGISAVELRNRLKGVGVEATSVGKIAEIVGDIATEELAKMGDQADTTADKIAQIGTAFENMQRDGGDALIHLALGIAISLGILSEFETELLDLQTTWNDLSLNGLGNQLDKEREKLEKLDAAYVEFVTVGNDGLDPRVAALREIQIGRELRLQKELIDSLEDTIESRKELLGVGSGNDFEGVTPEEIERRLAALKSVIVAEKEEVNNIVLLNTQLKDLKTKLSEASIGSDQFFEITKRITDKTKELNEAIAQTKLQDAFKIDDEDPFEVLGDGLVEFGDETENATTHADDAWNAHFENLMNGQDEAFENGKKLREKELSDTLTFVAAVQNIAGGLSDLQQALSDQELANLKTQLDQEQITREQYDVKRKELLNKQAEDDKQFAIFDAVISGAVAVVKAFADGGPVLAALVAAGVALQVATIAATPTPQFAEGGWVDSKGLIHGRSHAGGGVKIEAEGNEYITAGKYAKPNAAILEAINTGNWEKYKMENIITPAINQVLDGGFSGMGASYMLNNNFNDRNMLTAFDRNRKSERDSARFIVSELTKSLGGRKRGNYA